MSDPAQPLSRQSDEADPPPVDRCPWCEEEGRDVRGTVDGRVKIGGRYIYRCPENREHRWQDANETPSTKGFTAVGDLHADQDHRRESLSDG